jgi:hypothetical protein
MKMIGKTNQPPCGSHCCGDRSKKHKRTAKRRERQNWKKDIR